MSEEKELTDEERIKLIREANNKVNADRLERMEAIADSRDKAEELEDESARTERLAQEADEAAAKALQEEGVKASEPAEDEPKDEDTKSVNGETYYRQIVNGQEKWQTLKEIRTSASKVESADDYLRQASESVRNASRLALSEEDVAGNLKEDEVRKLLAGIALGDEEAIGRLAPIISKLSGPTPDVAKIVDQRVSFRTELAQLEGEYKDLLQDEDLGDLFRAKLSRLRQEKPETGLAEAYHSIGKQLRGRFGAKDKLSDRLERKRTLPQVPSAASRQAVATEEEGEEDAGSVIEEMAKARGFIPHVHQRRQ